MREREKEREREREKEREREREREREKKKKLYRSFRIETHPIVTYHDNNNTIIMIITLITGGKASHREGDINTSYKVFQHLLSSTPC